MKILVYGAGALGSFVGSVLSGENDVVLLCRGGHAESIRKYGLKINSIDPVNAHHTMQVKRLRAVTAPDEWFLNSKEKPELIILTVKSYDTADAAACIKKVFGNCTPVLTMQNGLRNVDILLRQLGSENVIGGLTSHGITRVKDGHICHAGVGETVFGAADCSGRASTRHLRLVRTVSRMFVNSGIRNRITMNFKGEMWAKAIINTGINPLTAITGYRNGSILVYPELERILESACREAVAVAKAAGIKLPRGDMVARAKNVARQTAENRSSMLQDIEKNKRTEIDDICGTIAYEGDKHGVDTPVIDTLIGLVKARERISDKIKTTNITINSKRNNYQKKLKSHAK